MYIYIYPAYTKMYAFTCTFAYTYTYVHIMHRHRQTDICIYFYIYTDTYTYINIVLYIYTCGWLIRPYVYVNDVFKIRVPFKHGIFSTEFVLVIHSVQVLTIDPVRFLLQIIRLQTCQVLFKRFDLVNGATT